MINKAANENVQATLVVRDAGINRAANGRHHRKYQAWNVDAPKNAYPKNMTNPAKMVVSIWPSCDDFFF